MNASFNCSQNINLIFQNLVYQILIQFFFFGFRGIIFELFQNYSLNQLILINIQIESGMHGSNEQSQFSSNFDEKPIGKGEPNLGLSQYPPDFNPDNIDVEVKSEPLPLNKRVNSKVWKVRKEAFQQLLQLIQEDVHAYEEVESDTIQFITDPNHMCQEKAVKILNRYLEKDGKVSEEPKKIIKALLEKCLVMEKNDISSLSSQTMFLMMDRHPKILLSEVNEAILNKNPKICSSAITFLEKLINNYGIQKVDRLDGFKKHFTLLANSVRPTAKPQTISLFKEIYKWMGENTFNLSMHKQIQEQIQKFAKTYVKEPLVIKRGLNPNQMQKKMVFQMEEFNDEDAPSVDVLGPFDSRWVDKVLEIQKWKEKKNQLDEFIKKIDVKKITPRDVAHYITLIKRLLNDKNINILQCAFKIVKNLSKGLRKNFNHPCKVFQGLVFSKLKDSKSVIVEETHETLKAMMNCISIEEIAQEIKEGLQDKAATMRFQTLKFLKGMISSKDKKIINAFKNFIPKFVEMNQDGSSEVREIVLEILCKLKAAHGSCFFGDKLKPLPFKKLTTIQNYIDPENPQPCQEKKQYSMDIEENTYQREKSKQIQNKQNLVNRMKESQSQAIISEAPYRGISINISELDSNIENTRNNFYQNLILLKGPEIQTELFENFKNKVPIARQSSMNILRMVLSVTRKAAPTILNLQHVEFILYHDWRKHKSMLTDFIQSCKMSLPALQYAKNSGIFNNNLSVLTRKDSEQSPNITVKAFIGSILALIPKISNPNNKIKMQTAETLINLVTNLPVAVTGEHENQSQETFSQFYNVLKCRVLDQNVQIANKYIEVTAQLLSRGFLVKHKGSGKIIITSLIHRLGDDRLTNIDLFIGQMVKNQSQILWQYLSPEICKENLCRPILNIIDNENQSFFKHADQKSYILPLLTCMSNGFEYEKASSLLNQIIEINGEKCLEKIMKQSRLPNLQDYAKKWKINIEVPHRLPTQGSNQQIMNTGNTSCQSKADRLSAQIENPWPLIPSPSHIIKLMGTFIAYGEPFSIISVPMPLTERQIEIVLNLTPQFLEEYSDLLVKWIFWRVHIDNSLPAMQCIFGLTKRLLTIGFELHETEIVILLGALSGCMVTHQKTFLKIVCDVINVMKECEPYKEKVFRFWINSFNDSEAPIDEIISMIIQCFENEIPSELVTLARYPSIVKNQQLNHYLKSKFSEKMLNVYGFKSQVVPEEGYKMKSQNVILENFQESEAKQFQHIILRSTSNEVVDKITEHTSGLHEQLVMDAHLKIMNAAIQPYLNGDLPFINVYNYFKYIQSIISHVNVERYLLLLMRTFIFFLIDLDEIKPDNNSEMMKTVNKILLILLEISEPKHILEVLFILMRQQIKIQDTSRTSSLLAKCVGKVFKNPSFRAQYERSSQVFEWLTYIIHEIKSILCEFNINDENHTSKGIKNVLYDIITMYPQTSKIFEQILSQERLSAYGSNLFQEILKSRESSGTGGSLLQTPIEPRAKAEIIRNLATFVDRKGTKE